MGKVKYQIITSRTDFFYYVFRNILLVSIPLLVVSSVVLFHLSFHSSALHNSSSDIVSILLPSSCTLSVTGNNSHTTNMVSGQLKENIGSTEINTLCNDKDGYVVYVKGITQDSNNNAVLAASSLDSTYDIKTGNIPSTNGNSSWAFKLNVVAGDYAPTIESAYNDQYATIPNDWTKVASRTSGTSTNPDISVSAKSAFTTTYAVYTTPSQPADTYTGQVQYILMHPSSSATIGTTLEKAFLLAGKQKITIYDDNGTTTTDSVDPVTGEPNTLIGSYYKIQDMNTSICNTTNITGEASQLQLLDIRDYKTYWATKLADGNCWMTQSLDLDLISDTTAQNYVALTSENTDIDPNTCDTTNHTCTTAPYATGYSIDQSTNVITWVPVRSTITELNSTNWKNDNNTPYSWDRATAYPENNQATAGNHGLAGNYYNWSAAIASSDSSGFTTNNADASNSICPKGWRLPSIANSEFGNLLTAEGIIANPTSTSYISGKFNSMITAPLYLVRAGSTDSGILWDSDKRGDYWSNTVYTNLMASNLSFSNITISNPNQSRYFGASLRCLAR